MIATEVFRKFRKKDFLAMFILAGLWALAAYLSDNYLVGRNSYIVSMLAAAFFVSFGVMLIKKAGTALFIYLLSALISYSVSDFGITKMNKLYVFLLAGIIFEIIFIIARLEFKTVPLYVVLSTMLSIASIPISTSLLLSWTITITLLKPLLNLIILGLFIGSMGSLIATMVWMRLCHKKLFLRFEYSI